MCPALCLWGSGLSGLWRASCQPEVRAGGHRGRPDMQSRGGAETATPAPHTLTHTVIHFSSHAPCERSRHHCVSLWGLSGCVDGSLVLQEKGTRRKRKEQHTQILSEQPPNLPRRRGFSRHRLLSDEIRAAPDRLGESHGIPRPEPSSSQGHSSGQLGQRLSPDTKQIGDLPGSPEGT